jgi:hypothetical protein
VPGDTHFILEIEEQAHSVIHSPEPIIDPVTGVATHAWTVPHAPQHLRVEGGYDAAGRTILVVDDLRPVGDPLTEAVNTTRRTRSVEDEIARYDDAGRLLPNEWIEPFRAAEPAHAQITDGLVLDAAADDDLRAFDWGGPGGPGDPVCIQGGWMDDCPPLEDDPPPPAPSCDPVSGGANLLYLHGTLSSGSSWQRMAAWINCDFRTAHSTAPDLPWYLHMDAQRDYLQATLPAGIDNLIVVGHGSGGLVSRALAQWAQTSDPNRVRGVVTLDAPNQGAILANNAKALEYVVATLAGVGLQWLVIDMFV